MTERTFCIAKPQGNLEVLKQTLEVENEVYLLNGVYGENESEPNAKDCIICLGHNKDTMILPCRHLSLCRNCALQVSMEMKYCPICRKSKFFPHIEISSMLTLTPVELSAY